jgi:hypothetical protein
MAGERSVFLFYFLSRPFSPKPHPPNKRTAIFYAKSLPPRRRTPRRRIEHPLPATASNRRLPPRHIKSSSPHPTVDPTPPSHTQPRRVLLPRNITPRLGLQRCRREKAATCNHGSVKQSFVPWLRFNHPWQRRGG